MDFLRKAVLEPLSERACHLPGPGQWENLWEGALRGQAGKAPSLHSAFCESYFQASFKVLVSPFSSSSSFLLCLKNESHTNTGLYNDSSDINIVERLSELLSFKAERQKEARSSLLFHLVWLFYTHTSHCRVFRSPRENLVQASDLLLMSFLSSLSRSLPLIYPHLFTFLPCGS